MACFWVKQGMGTQWGGIFSVALTLRGKCTFQEPHGATHCGVIRDRGRTNARSATTLLRCLHAWLGVKVLLAGNTIHRQELRHRTSYDTVLHRAHELNVLLTHETCRYLAATNTETLREQQR